jgi:hypothetical protein
MNGLIYLLFKNLIDLENFKIMIYLKNLSVDSRLEEHN